MIKFLEIFFGLLSIVGTAMIIRPEIFASLVSRFVTLSIRTITTVGNWLSFAGMIAIYIISLVK